MAAICEAHVGNIGQQDKLEWKSCQVLWATSQGSHSSHHVWSDPITLIQNHCHFHCHTCHPNPIGWELFYFHAFRYWKRLDEQTLKRHNEGTRNCKYRQKQWLCCDCICSLPITSQCQLMRYHVQSVWSCSTQLPSFTMTANTSSIEASSVQHYDSYIPSVSYFCRCINIFIFTLLADVAHST